MATTNAQRQAAYRQRHFKEVDGERVRLDLALSVPAKAQLERLASCYRVTQREVLERLLQAAERELVQSLPAGEQCRYYDRELVLPGNG